MGDPGQAYLPSRTGSLRVRHCDRVVLVPGALSTATQLADLELSDLGRLELQADSLYRDEDEDGDGPPGRVTVERVADLHVDPSALRGVRWLQQLELTEVVAGPLPLDIFVANGSSVASFRLGDSQTEDVRLRLNAADSVTVTNCTIRKLDVSVGDVASVAITDNTVSQLACLRLGVRYPYPQIDDGANDANVTIARNNITTRLMEWGCSGKHMNVNRLTIANNTVAEWHDPMRVEFLTADITGNVFHGLDVFALAGLVRVDPGSNSSHRRPTAEPTEFALTFSDNTVQDSDFRWYDLLLNPTRVSHEKTALFGRRRTDLGTAHPTAPQLSHPLQTAPG